MPQPTRLPQRGDAVSSEIPRSPLVLSISWGRMDVEEIGVGKDFKLYPGGGRPWDWSETGTRHSPGVQPDDVQELLSHGAKTVVLSRGMQLQLQIDARTLGLFEECGVTVHVAETTEAVQIYNSLARDGIAVAGLFHSTC
ncbi:Mth938-like domain-containing protein [Micromonospora sp. NPDC005710]|uniref:Mth938-like domain-containing protein n=1 Tax=Micromonospora sp. NPDC005710 TaxID=3157051 RepID=UPI003406340C